MPTPIDYRRIFLREMARQAPDIIHDLFIRYDAKEWAGAWGLLSEWVIRHAEWTLNSRGGNREGMRWALERGFRDADLARWKAEELRAWMSATDSPSMPGPLRLVINVFAPVEDFRYLTPDEVWARVEGDIRAAVAAYHKEVFEDHPIFRNYKLLPAKRAGQDEKHLAWLIAYIASAPDGTDSDIADSEGIEDETTVKSGRNAFARRIELKLKPRKGRRRKTEDERAKK